MPPKTCLDFYYLPQSGVWIVRMLISAGPPTKKKLLWQVQMCILWISKKYWGASLCPRHGPDRAWGSCGHGAAQRVQVLTGSIVYRYIGTMLSYPRARTKALSSIYLHTKLLSEPKSSLILRQFLPSLEGFCCSLCNYKNIID